MKNASEPQRKHVVVSGESLDQIARHYYGTQADVYLSSLYEANRALVVKDPNHLRPGITLAIPEMEGEEAFFDKNQST